jgi:MFS family permease
MGLGDKIKGEFSFIYGNYLILVISWILMDIVNEMPGTYYPLYVMELGGSASIIGLIGFVSLIALASVQFPGGYLADKYGRKWLISTMTFGIGISFVFYAIAPSWHMILVGAIVMNLCLIYQPALMAMVADSLPPEKRGMGYSIIMLIASVSSTPGPMIAGFLYLNFGLVGGMRTAYFITVVFYLVAAVLRLKLKETLTETKRISRKELLNSYPTSIKESVRVWKIVPRSMLFLFIANLIIMVSFSMINPYLVVYAVKNLGIGEFEWSIALFLLFIVMIIVALPSGKLIDKVGRKLPFLTSSIVLFPSILIFIYGDFTRLLITLPFIGLSQILGSAAYSSLQADLVPKEQRGKVIGFTNFTNYVFMAFGQLIGGILYEIAPQLPFWACLTMLPMAFLVGLLFVQEPEKREI